ncbi:MAG: response regulator transcription factor [Bacteroidia bacterium]|nr:response regulator transcription factor [Bacteroidia bacterium]
MKILLVEYEPDLREILVKSLIAERYIVEEASNFTVAEEKINLYDYDCILLDIMLPDGNGLELLRQLKIQKKQEGVIILSARDAIDDRIEGLELGADDYLPKPFHLAELHARIRSVMRRKQQDGSPTIEFGNVSIDPKIFSVTVNKQPIELSRKEYDLLHYFINRHGYTIKKEQLAEAVWGDYIDQCDNFDFIYAQIKNVRRKLEEAQASVEIKAVYGFGYKMIEKA